MSLTRIALNTTASYSGAYYLTLNPSVLELNDSQDYSTFELIDGGLVKQKSYFDDRLIILRWFRIPKDFSGFSSMLSTLQGYIDSKKYINFGTADYRVSISSAWIYVRVLDLKVSIESGGSLRYNVELHLVKETT
jgi:hypothetical protein